MPQFTPPFVPYFVPYICWFFARNKIIPWSACKQNAASARNFARLEELNRFNRAVERQEVQKEDERRKAAREAKVRV